MEKKKALFSGTSGYSRPKCAKISHFGMFRCQLHMKMNSDDNRMSGHDWEVSGNGEQIEDIQYIANVVSDNGRNGRRTTGRGSRQRMDMYGNQVRRGRIVRRRRIRRLDIEEFRMFDQNGIIPRRNVTCNRENAQTEREKFEHSISEELRCTDNLDLRWSESPYLRCSGFRRRKQKLVTVSTVRTKKKWLNGENLTTIIVSMAIEEE